MKLDIHAIELDSVNGWNILYGIHLGAVNLKI